MRNRNLFKFRISEIHSLIVKYPSAEFPRTKSIVKCPMEFVYNFCIPRSSGDMKTVVVSSSSKPFVVSIKSFGVVSANTVIVVSGIVEVVSGKVVVDSANVVKFKTTAHC